jgi:hypothetical protein
MGIKADRRVLPNPAFKKLSAAMVVQFNIYTLAFHDYWQN